MKSFFKLFSDSAKELKSLRSLAGIGVLLALSIALSFATIRIGQTVKIGPGFLITALLGMLYGPVAGGIAAAAGDLIKWMIAPDGPLHLGFTLTAFLGGVVYGIAFYKCKYGWWRAIISKTTVNLLLNCVLNTIWLFTLYGEGVALRAAGRVLKNLVALPLEIVALYFLLAAVAKVLQKNKLIRT